MPCDTLGGACAASQCKSHGHFVVICFLLIKKRGALHCKNKVSTSWLVAQNMEVVSD